jgi:HSP20 family protein
MNAVSKIDQNKELEKTINYVSPVVDIYETKDAYVLQADMPGVQKDGLEVLLEDNTLTLVGHRTPGPMSGDVLMRESKESDFRRVFELDPAIDAARIKARMDQGVLTLDLPKAERVKPRRIEVTA